MKERKELKRIVEEHPEIAKELLEAVVILKASGKEALLTKYPILRELCA